MKVAIAGAGAVGRSIAQELIRGGHELMLLERRLDNLDTAARAPAPRLGVATAATNHHTRHPLVTATMGATLAELTGGRFALGVGRAAGPGAAEAHQPGFRRARGLHRRSRAAVLTKTGRPP
ncbi:LLM class flavin-dependent oxidoreductase, partial [Nocardia wallacei]|uniref:LLM class flavin-dependent oxidoreductase n=1 Tax=Nocardia wallacei TaxID=480035 RepID=UPI002456CE5E